MHKRYGGKGSYVFGKKAFAFGAILFGATVFISLLDKIFSKESTNNNGMQYCNSPVIINNCDRLNNNSNEDFLLMKNAISKVLHRLLQHLYGDKEFFYIFSKIQDSYFNHSIEAMLLDIISEENFASICALASL